MNQILKPEQNMLQKPSNSMSNNSKSTNLKPNNLEPNNLKTSPKKKNYKMYQFQFLISLLIAIGFFIVFLMHWIRMNENEKLSKQLLRAISN